MLSLLLPLPLPWIVLIHGTKADIRKYIILEKLMLRILEYQSYLASQGTSVIFLSPDILSIVSNGTGSRTDQSIEMLDQCRFSTSCMSDNSDKLSVRNRKIDIFQRMDLIGSSRTVGISYIFLILLT